MKTSTNRTKQPTPAKAAEATGVLYVRVSSKEQEEEGYSMPAQQRLLRDYAQRKGLNVVEEFIEAETAKKAGRKAFEQMLKFASDNSIKAILVEKTDRLYRNFSDFVKVDELGVDLHFVKEGQVISTNSHSSEKLMHSIKVCLAKNYIDNLSEEIRKGLAEKAMQGIYPTHAPLGYLNVPDGARKKIVPDPERAGLVRRLFEVYALGQVSIKDCTSLAWKIGLRTKKGNRVHRSAIGLILTNDVYTGKVTWQGKQYPGIHEPIIDEATFFRVQEIMTGRCSRLGFGSVPIAYRGIIRCAQCGGVLSGEIKKGKYVYYHCTGRREGCTAPYVKEQVLSDQFAAMLETMSIPDTVLEDLKAMVIESSKDEQRFARDQRRNLDQDIERQRGRLATLYEDKIAGDVSGDTYQLLHDRYTKQLAETEQLRRNLSDTGKRWREDCNRFLELASTASDRFKQADSDQRRNLLGLLVSNCLLDGKILAIELRPEFKMLFESASAAKQKALETGQSVDWWRIGGSNP